MADNVMPYLEDEVVNSYDDTITNAVTTVAKGISFNFDFAVGDFIVKDGKVEELTGIEALKIYIEKLLKTEKFKFKIYETGAGDEYGITISDLIHSDFSYIFIKSELEREITEELVKNTDITSIENFIFTREKRALAIAFTVNSIYGTTESEVIY